MRYFCTYFDHHYLPRGLALYRSLRRHCPSFQLWVLCMDRASYKVLSQSGLSDIHLVALEDFEKGDDALLRSKQNRTLIEYYFTCTPSLPLYILNNYPGVDSITYLDADLFFFTDPAAIFDEVADYSVAIVEHRFPPYLRGLERFGVYNVGWLSFRRDERALACLQWWRERCIEWCYDTCEDGRFADQKYLDNWPNLFQGVVVVRHKGANLGPWNVGNYRIHWDGNRVWVDEQPLVFFHFHGLKQLNAFVYDPNLVSYGVKHCTIIRRKIYGPYIRMLVEAARQVLPMMPMGSFRGGIRDLMVLLPEPVHLPRRVLRRIRILSDLCRGLLAGWYFPVVNGHVL